MFHVLPWPSTNAGKMTLSDDVNLEEFVMAKDELSGADIKVRCSAPLLVLPGIFVLVAGSRAVICLLSISFVHALPSSWLAVLYFRLSALRLASWLCVSAG